MMVSSSLWLPLLWPGVGAEEEAGWTLVPPLRIHSCRVKWSPDTAAATALGTAAMWAEPLKEKTREESEEGRVGRDEVQLAAGEGGGRRSTSPLTAPGDKRHRGDPGSVGGERLAS